MFVNPVPPLRIYLKSKTTAADRVYGEELPEGSKLTKDSIIVDQLQDTIVLTNVPGFVDRDIPFQFPRIYVRCYAKDRTSAITLFYSMLNTIHNVTIDNENYGRIVVWLNGGPTCDVDEKTKFIYAEGYLSGAMLGKAS